MADNLGVSLSTYQNLESKDYPIKSNYLLALAQTFGDLDLNWLVTGRGIDSKISSVQNVNKSSADFQPGKVASLEKRVIGILQQVERIFSSPRARYEFAEFLLRIVEQEQRGNYPSSS